MDKKKKILIWTLVGIIAAVVILTTVFALVNGGISKMGLIFLWVGLLFGVAIGVICHMLKVLPDEELLATMIAEKYSEKPEEEVKEPEPEVVDIAAPVKKKAPAKKKAATKK